MEGENLIWRVDFVGRSTPVVFGGRVFVTGRVGDGIDKQEQVACFDAADGKLLWEKRFNVFLTSVPFPRVGWSNLVGDPETGNIYFHGVSGLLVAMTRDGEVLWEHSLTERFGRYSGYGGRIDSPVLDRDLLILGFATSGWGDMGVPRHRFTAFDKRTGQVIWVSTPGGAPADLNTYSTPVVAEINGQRLLIGGSGDGAVYALRVATGEKVWGFNLSKRGLNSAVVVSGDRVYASHSEENIEEASMGRVVCIDGTGSGDVTGTHEVWRHDKLQVGFSSPVLHDGKLYVLDNSANLYVLNADTGERLTEFGIGTVGKGSPVVADGKLYATEVNGAFHILDISGPEVRSLSGVKLFIGNRHPDIYGSPAVAYRRIYFATEEGLYCLGDPKAPFEPGTGTTGSLPGQGASETSTPNPSVGPAVSLQVTPAELDVHSPGETAFTAELFDARGNRVGRAEPAWSLQGLTGEMEGTGVLRVGSQRVEAGKVIARVGQLEGAARVRVFPGLPWSEGFDSVEEGRFPGHWIGAFGKFEVKQLEDGNKVLVKERSDRGIQRALVFVGPPEMRQYVVQVDVRGVRDRRRIPDMGVVADRYVMSLEGNSQKLAVRSWLAEKRMEQLMDFPWQSDVWYTMKMKVDVSEGRAVVLGKVWPRDEPEPESWIFRVEDPHANPEGSPGLYGQSYANIYYDNLMVRGESN